MIFDILLQASIILIYLNFRPDSGKYSPSDIDPSLCTHIVYAFAVLDSSKLIIKPHDVFLDVENSKFPFPKPS